MDEYEKKHFAGQGRVLLRDKVAMSRGAAGAVVLTGVGFLLAGVAGLISAIPPLAMIGLSFGLPILGIVPVFGVVRLLVTEHELRLQVGVGGPRVAIDEIERMALLAPTERGARKAREYALKDGHHALELHLRDGTVVRIRSTEERVERLAAALREARNASGVRARVALEPDVATVEAEGQEAKKQRAR